MGTKRVCSCALRSTWNIRGRYGETRGGSLVITRLADGFSADWAQSILGGFVWLALAMLERLGVDV